MFQSLQWYLYHSQTALGGGNSSLIITGKFHFYSAFFVAYKSSPTVNFTLLWRLSKGIVSATPCHLERLPQSWSPSRLKSEESQG